MRAGRTALIGATALTAVLAVAAGCVRDAALRSQAETIVVADGTSVPVVDAEELLAAHRALETLTVREVKEKVRFCSICGNVADQTTGGEFAWVERFSCSDGWWLPAPVSSPSRSRQASGGKPRAEGT